METAAPSTYRFDRFVLHPDIGALLVNGTECVLRRKTLVLLRHFLDNAGRVISRDEIMQVVWPGVFVTDDSIAQCVKDIRRALDDRAQRLLRTLPRRGYLFTAQAVVSPTELLPLPSSRASAGTAPTVGLSLPGGPSIAVIPFQTMGGDPAQQYFADGMVEEIITALSRIPWLFVIARHSSFAYRDDGADVRQIGRELGVRYVLEGSTRSAAGRVRITVQLIEAETGSHLWADRFDGPLEDVFALQDQVAIAVAGVVEPTLQAAERQRSSTRPTQDLTAYDLYLRATAPYLSYDRASYHDALALLEQAIARDPQYGPAYGMAANYLFQLEVNGWSDHAQRDESKAIDFVRRALSLSPDDPRVLAEAGIILAYFGEDIDASLALIGRALGLMPSSARGWLCSGWTRLWSGAPDLAIEHFERSLRLNPRSRGATHLTGIGIAHLVSRRFTEATARLAESLQQLPSFAWTYRALAASYVHLGRHDDAQATVRRLLTITPSAVPRMTHYRDLGQRELFASALRRAVSITKKV
jgi:TolB-like protein/Flp pilus assembly protein TadD